MFQTLQQAASRFNAKPVAFKSIIRTVVQTGAISSLLLGMASAQTVSQPTRACAQDSIEALAWITPASAAPALTSARQTLLAAYTHGLDPADYRADDLDARAHELLARVNQPSAGSGATSLAGELSAFNRDFTIQLACLLTHTRLGALQPEQLHGDIDIPQRRWNAADALKQAWHADELEQLLHNAYPANRQYQGLRIALARYRELANRELASSAHWPITAAVLTPGMRDMAVRELRERLVLLGDMSEHERLEAELADTVLETDPAVTADTAPILAPRYDRYTVDAVRRFQARHALLDDGIVGRKTLAELNTPIFQRIAQIEMSMERLRWLPEFDNERVIRVNLPEFRLTADHPDQSEPLDAKVVIGKSGSSPTPMYVGRIKHLEISPFWYVPAEIARSEILPRLRDDPSRLARMDMEITTANGQVHREATPAILDALASGRAKLRQRPGERNALGRFKFVLPNSRGIYLHDTSSRHLFARTQRDLSHGCVRVEDPMALARLILQDSPGWDDERLADAANADRPTYARPVRPVIVVFSYETARINAHGQVNFLPDVYDYDSRTLASVRRWATMNHENVNSTARNSDEGRKLARLSFLSL